MRHLAYDWGKVYTKLLLNTDNAKVLVRDAKHRLKILIEKETDEKVRRDLRYELRFLRWFWRYSVCCDCCDCCECNGCDFSPLESPT